MYGWLMTDAEIMAENVGVKGWRIDIPHSGIYRLYNEKGELLYIGWATYLAEGILEHCKGRSKNTGHFHTEIYRILVTSAGNFDNVFANNKKGIDVESLTIKKLKPKYNKLYSLDYKPNSRWKDKRRSKR
ncbi:GIY-YIG nuclease family protein [Bacillus sp. MMSF_3328]|uniref:GIY-YIG nuclease family protein n=1 Tax=Bacillus sp. MMSF_3328 TaxID=3047080 RepID=UPI00273D40C0|nr:GIY-YIG nuclease family protein [Bacillus sp. MMSF_3328]